MPSKKTIKKKVAPTPAALKKAGNVKDAQKNPLFEKRPKNFGIGEFYMNSSALAR